MGGLGASSGALLGGILTQTFGWPAIFAVNVPLGAIVIALGLRVIPTGCARDVDRRRHFDVTGAVLVTAGLALATYGIVRTDTLGWGSSGVLVPLAAAAALLAAFVFVEQRVATRAADAAVDLPAAAAAAANRSSCCCTWGCSRCSSSSRCTSSRCSATTRSTPGSRSCR